MMDVCIALLPAVLVSILVFGLYPLVVVILSVAAAVFGEYLYNVLRKKPHTTGDFSAVVTGLLLGLNLPPVVPLYIPIVGGIFATMLVKMLFGGIGKNFANPAITARIFLVLAWGAAMTAYVVPVDWSQGAEGLIHYFKYTFSDITAVTGATPLQYVKTGDLGDVNLLNMFLGTIGGCAGETSALALLVGGAYLGLKRIIDVKIPLIYIGTTAFLALVFKGIDYVLPFILGGGLMIGAIFMATDYSTSPNTKLGVIIYSVMLGVLTVIIRVFSKMPEGVSFAILLMNIVTPLLDKYIIPKPFGYVKPVKPEKVKEGSK
jgi:electron transport complex protein RnfD